MEFANMLFSNPIACDQVVRFIKEAMAANPKDAIVDPYAHRSSREFFEHLDEMLDAMHTPENPVKGRALCSMVEPGSPLLSGSKGTGTWSFFERSQGGPLGLAVTSLLDDSDESLLNHLKHVLSCYEYAAIRLSSKQVKQLLLTQKHPLEGLLRQHMVGLVVSSDMAHEACWLLSMREKSNLKTPELRSHGLSLQRLPVLSMSDLWAILDTPNEPHKLSREAHELVEFFKLMPCFTENVEEKSSRGFPKTKMVPDVPKNLVNRIARWSDKQSRKPRAIDVYGPNFEAEIQKMAQKNYKELCKDVHSRDESIRSKDRKAGMEPSVGVVLHKRFGTVTGFEKKDPRRQTTHENVEFQYYWDMKDLVNRPHFPERDGLLKKAPWARWLVDNGWTMKVQQFGKGNDEYMIINGGIHACKKGDRPKDAKTKSLDGMIVFMHQDGTEVTVWITSKHTDEEGGSQDNQMADLKKTLAYASEMPSNGRVLVVAVVNGNYYQRKDRIKELHEAANQASHVLVLPSKDLFLTVVEQHLQRLAPPPRPQEAPLLGEPQTPTACP